MFSTFTPATYPGAATVTAQRNARAHGLRDARKGEARNPRFGTPSLEAAYQSGVRDAGGRQVYVPTPEQVVEAEALGFRVARTLPGERHRRFPSPLLSIAYQRGLDRGRRLNMDSWRDLSAA